MNIEMSESYGNLKERIIKLEQKIESLNDEISELRERIASMEGQITLLLQKSDIMSNLIKYVVTPLILILAGLVGLKIAIPAP